MSIAVIGSNNTDLITYITRMPVEGETIEALDFEIGFGGKGSNQAIAAAKLGTKVTMVTCVGDDAFGESYLQNYRNNGIDTSFVKQVHGTSGVAPIFVDQESHNSIIIVKGANKGLTPKDLEEAADAISECSLIVLQLEIAFETVKAAIALGNRLGIPVLLNPAPATKELDLALAAKCQYVMPNETELELLTGLPTSTDDEVRVAAQVLLDAGCANVIVTLGSRGVWWLSADGGDVRLEQFPAKAIDTTGAGDAFIGCFSHCLSEGLNEAEALELANAYAALSVMGRGTQKSYRDAQEFSAWLSEAGSNLATSRVFRL